MRVNLRVVMCIVVSLAIVGLSANVAFAQIEVPGTCQKIGKLVPFDSQLADSQQDAPLIWRVVPECALCEFHRVEIHVGKPDKEKKLAEVTFQCKATGEVVVATEWKGHEKGVDENPNHEVWSAEFTSFKCTGEVNVTLVPVLPVPEPVIKVAFVSKLWDLWNCSPIGGAPWGNEEINVHVGKPDKDKKIDRVGFVCVASGEQRIEEDWKGHEKDVDTNPNHELWGTTFDDKCVGAVDVYLLPVDKGNKAEIKAVFFTNITPRCDAVCKDGTQNQTKATDEQSCRDDCNTFCDDGHDGIYSCLFKDVQVKGQCVATCKVGPPQTTAEEDKDACEVECDIYCAPFATNLKSCVFKDQNIKGNCVAECKDERVLNNWDYDAAGCHSQCDTFCGTNDDVKACFFKNENIKGGLCSAKCKDGTSGTRPAQDKGDCHLRCDDICGGDKANVLWCQFKEQNVKGNCDVTCKDELSDHIMLPSTNPPYENTPEVCQTWCKETCLGHGGTLTCDHKGDPTVPAVTTWGMVVMGLLVLTAGTMVVLRRRPETA